MMSLTTRNAVLLLTLVAVVALSSGLGCYMALRWMPRRVERAGVDHSRGHEWLHEQLHLGAEQLERLEPTERRFAAREKALTAAIEAANVELADAFRRDRAMSEEVQSVLKEIHRAQAELQTLTLEHLVEMRTALTEEQYEQLLDLVAEALRAKAQPH